MLMKLYPSGMNLLVAGISPSGRIEAKPSLGWVQELGFTL